MARDSLRATLDNLQVDPASAKDRPYLEAMLLRLGYTEKEIREELGPVAEADVTVVKDAVPAGDLVAPQREYRLVIPARESSFSLDNRYGQVGTDSPFEDFERVEFAPAGEEETVEFQEVPQEPAVTPLEEVEFTPEAPLQEFQEAAEPAEAVEETKAEEVREFQPSTVEQLQADEQGAGVDDVSIDTFGGDVASQPKTRVRVKRVRARSKAEAEAKVGKGNRRVIKSIPVDIVERWGEKGPKGGQP